jgi:hypothetical protein
MYSVELDVGGSVIISVALGVGGIVMSIRIVVGRMVKVGSGVGSAGATESEAAAGGADGELVVGEGVISHTHPQFS